MLSGYLGLLLLGACFISIGLFISSTTKNQMVAGAATFVVLLMFWIIGWFADSSGPTTAAILNYLSITQHFDDFGKGVIDTKHVVFYPELHRVRAVPDAEVGGHRTVEGLTVKRLLGILGWLGVAARRGRRRPALRAPGTARPGTSGWRSPGSSSPRSTRSASGATSRARSRAGT